MTKVTRYPPGEIIIWLFIMAELLVFGLFFAAYAITRIDNIELFELYQQNLDTTAALYNTIALLSSSYFVIRSVIAIKADEQKMLIDGCC